ncbi:hypothetical protein EDC04DRAFT_818826 [Pisolithus marmoratus]|nr:hypothetical protein EDC04DRAFT_818826 [Pisolithus marmoratus]
MMVAKQIEIVSQSDVFAVTFADESQVVGGYANRYIRRWNVEDGQQQGPAMQAGNRIYSIVVSKDGRWMVTGDWGKVVVWNTATHEKALEFTEHDGLVWAVDISSDCAKVASVDGGTAQIFSITSGIRLFPPLLHDCVVGVKFSPDGSRFATASRDGSFRVYSTHNGDILFDSGPKGSTGSWPVTPLVWSSDGQQLFVATLGKIACFYPSKSSSLEWFTHETGSSVFIASNGRFIACSAGSSVSLWDCVSHKQIRGIISHTAAINCIALSPSGGYLACGLRTGEIAIHNLRDVLPLQFFDSGSCALCNAFVRRQLHTSLLPLVQASDETLESWAQDDLTNTELLLSEEITNAASPSHHILANRALIRVRLNNSALGIEDAKRSLQILPSPIGYIATAVALLAQGDREDALCTFDLAFHDCDPRDIRFLLLLKSILVFESGNHEEAITRVERLATRANNDSDDEATYLYTQVLGVMYLKKGNYGRAIPFIERAKNLAPKEKQCPPVNIISLKIFGWSFDGLDIVAQQRLCETLYAEGRAVEAVAILNIIRSSYEVIQGSQAATDWISDFTKKCAATLEYIGDEALRSAKHDDAISQYSTALSLSPPSPVGLLIKRGTTRAAKGLWEDALLDANEAVKVDSSCPWGYEVKHMALHGAKRYDEAIDAFESMLHVIEHSDDPEIRQQRENYISPSETVAAIDPVALEILKGCPLVVIDVTTGCLCDGPERLRIFKTGLMFKELVSSMTRKVDSDQIQRVIESFFGYVMFSHAWQGDEPSFQDVNVAKSVWNLADTPLNAKLCNFCTETHRLGHNWAWSDTCCIDRATSSILNRSLTSMYKWYADSAATLVSLAGVAHPSKPGDLSRSLWMTRAWTLQELLAPKVIFFYDSEWKPYLGINGANHKESPEIMQELADAIKIPRGTIITFSPDDLGVREKLRLASTRNATVGEDVAYSLIGIFKSDIRPHYGEGDDALGHLLEEIVSRSGEVAVLAWSGKSSIYNSCLPASISVYNQIPYTPSSLGEEEMETCIRELRGKLSQQVALSIYNQINFLPPTRFVTRRLYLPCFVFPVRRLGIQELRQGNEKLYRARVSGLGEVEFTTTDDLPLREPQKFVFVHPWIRHIRGPSSEVTWGDDSDSDTDTDSNSDCGTGSDEAAPYSPLHAVPAPQVDDYTRALRMLARLRQPFIALLLLQQLGGEYKRVAAENEIIVSGVAADITSKYIRVKVLEVL